MTAAEPRLSPQRGGNSADNCSDGMRGHRIRRRKVERLAGLLD